MITLRDLNKTYASKGGGVKRENYRELIERKVMKTADYVPLFAMCRDAKMPFVGSVYDMRAATFAKEHGAETTKLCGSSGDPFGWSPSQGRLFARPSSESICIATRRVSHAPASCMPAKRSQYLNQEVTAAARTRLVLWFVPEDVFRGPRGGEDDSRG